METPAQQHFNAIAIDYDYWKKKNWYYHKKLKELYQSFIPAQSTVAKIGCGTGDILASLQPRKGLGIDISEEMITYAKKKYEDHHELTFST